MTPTQINRSARFLTRAQRDIRALENLGQYQFARKQWTQRPGFYALPVQAQEDVCAQLDAKHAELLATEVAS